MKRMMGVTAMTRIVIKLDTAKQNLTGHMVNIWVSHRLD